MPKRIQHERSEQQALVQWFRLQYPNELLVHTPNELIRGCVEARGAWLSGVVPGIPDLTIYAARGIWHGLLIEMKRKTVKGQSKGHTSLRQKEIIKRLNALGYLATIAYGWDEGREIIIEYLG